MSISLLERIGLRLAKKPVKQLKFEIKMLKNLVEGYLESPLADGNDKKALNGQTGRQQIVNDLLATYTFDYIAETGTHLGSSTAYFASKTDIPVYTSEIDPHYAGIVKLRLANFNNIQLYHNDSRQMLRDLAANNDNSNKTVFFYLDAHFFDDLPLLEEIQIIANNWPNFVILVDDFEVPNDKGYGYDDYGRNGKLTHDYIKPLVNSIPLSTWVPTLPSDKETGYRRGCVVITRQETDSPIDKLATLRRVS